MSGFEEPFDAPVEVNWASGHSAAHIITIISEVATAANFRPIPRISARPIASRPSMNSVLAHQVPAMLLKKDWNGPTSTPLRNPLVGDPPLIQDFAAGVA